MLESTESPFVYRKRIRLNYIFMLRLIISYHDVGCVHVMITISNVDMDLVVSLDNSPFTILDSYNKQLLVGKERTLWQIAVKLSLRVNLR